MLSQATVASALGERNAFSTKHLKNDALDICRVATEHHITVKHHVWHQVRLQHTSLSESAIFECYLVHARCLDCLGPAEWHIVPLLMVNEWVSGPCVGVRLTFADSAWAKPSMPVSVTRRSTG